MSTTPHEPHIQPTDDVTGQPRDAENQPVGESPTADTPSQSTNSGDRSFNPGPDEADVR